MLNPIEFGYTGKTQKITLYPDKAGIETFNTPFLVECWGAQGNSGDGGNYTKGILNIMVPTDLYINVGGAGGNGLNQYGWGSDGNGYSSYNNNYGYRCSGGSTSVSFKGTIDSTNWKDTEFVNNLLLRAKGGNGSNYTASTGFSQTVGRSCSLSGAVSSAGTTTISGSGTYSGRPGTWVTTITPSISGTLTFWSSNNSGDPYGFIYNSNGQQIAANDDSGGNRNFRISINVTAGTQYRLYCGSYSGSPSYTWNCTYPVPSSTTYTGASGSISNTLGTSGVIVLAITPKSDGYLTFYSNNRSAGNPYGRIYDSYYGSNYYNDDGNGDYNFWRQIYIYANRTYYLYAGSTSNTSWSLSPPVASYQWGASFPASTVTTYTGNTTAGWTYYWTITGGVNNYGDFYNPLLVQTGATGNTRSGNGLVRIRQWSIEPRNSDFRYDPAPQVAYDYSHFMKVINDIKGT